MEMLESLQAFYNGFYLEAPLGNNAFSYRERTSRKIFVPPLYSGDPGKLAVGKEIVFSEFNDGEEINKQGLRAFIYYPRNDQHFFIFDNHNHAFFFWIAARHYGIMAPGLPLLHVDQHTDMRQPETWFDEMRLAKEGLAYAFRYTNKALNVGNFIQPALKMGLFSRVDIVDSTVSFAKTYQPPYVLDIDLDIFSDDMAYIPEAEKLVKISGYISAAKIITIATSPYFIDQERAIKKIHELFFVAR